MSGDDDHASERRRFWVPRTPYELKKAVLAPRTVYRRKKSGDLGEALTNVFELSYHSTPTYEFLKATMANPDILVDAELDQESIVVDVGAYIGHWSKKILDRYGSTIYCFEPAAFGVEQIEKALGDRPEVHVLDYGLGRGNQVAKLAFDRAGSTIYSDDPRRGFEEVEIRDVVEVLDELGITRIDLLKVNIEGGEYDLFERLDEAGWLRRIDQVLIQFHEWHPHAYTRRWRIRRALRSGHELVWDFPWMWEKWRQPGPPRAVTGSA